MQGEEILTGEAVALEVGAASFAVRAASFLIDAAATLVLALVGVRIVSWLAPMMDMAAATALVTAGAVVCLIAVPALVETLSRGRSLGKVVMGYRIVRDDASPVRVREAFARAFAGLLELWATMGGLALLSSMLNARGKRLGDYLAGTYAVRTRAARIRLQPLIQPPELAGWAALADISGVPDALALRTRIFLQRASGFSPRARHEMAMRLAAAMEPHVAPPPPAGTGPERYLAAVLAARRDREAVLEAARSRAVAALVAPAARLGYGLPDPPG